MTETDVVERQTLAFESDSGSSRSRWVAGGLAVAIVGWMGSGFILPSAPPAETVTATDAPRAVSVAVRDSAAESVAQVFVAEGQALPDRDAAIRAETSGRVREVLVAKGADLDEGEVIARFDAAGRDAELTRAEEELARAQREFDNAQALLDRGVSTVDRVAQARTTLAAAEADVASARELLGDIEIRAPFAGRLEALDLSPGEFVSLGAEVGRIVDNMPLTLRIQVPQQSVADIAVGQTADIAFITGAEARGVVRFVGSAADVETRTFAAEIEVPNADGAIPAGISARLRIPTGETRAHFVSPAILSLGTDGTLGVKTVDGADTVVFHQVGIVRAQTDGIWVSGLPDEARIITIGQGFVNDGEVVDPIEDGGGGAERGPDPTAGLPDPTEQQAGDGRILLTERAGSGGASPEPDAATLEDVR